MNRRFHYDCVVGSCRTRKRQYAQSCCAGNCPPNLPPKPETGEHLNSYTEELELYSGTSDRISATYKTFLIVFRYFSRSAIDCKCTTSQNLLNFTSRVPQGLHMKPYATCLTPTTGPFNTRKLEPGSIRTIFSFNEVLVLSSLEKAACLRKIVVNPSRALASFKLLFANLSFTSSRRYFPPSFMSTYSDIICQICLYLTGPPAPEAPVSLSKLCS